MTLQETREQLVQEGIESLLPIVLPRVKAELQRRGYSGEVSPEVMEIVREECRKAVEPIVERSWIKAFMSVPASGAVN